MGGQGSGQYIRWGAKTRTESQSRVDIRFLKKQGWLIPNTSGILSWTCRGKPDGYINYRMETDRMVLEYNHRVNGGEWQPVEQVVRFDWTPCPLGGRRQWLLCPGCARRVAVIYGASRLFLCRHCHGLAYGSQQESRPDRLLRRARKIKERLGVYEPMRRLTVKPKGMHHKTFLDLRCQVALYEHLGWREVARTLGLSEELGL